MGQTFFPQIFMKVAIEPNFDTENSKIKLIFPIFFSFAPSFLPWLVKNVLKNGSIFFLRFSWKLPYNLILIWRSQKSNSFFQFFSSSSSFVASTFSHQLKLNREIVKELFHLLFFIFIFIFVSISEKWLKNESSIFSSALHGIFHILYFF